MSAVLHNIKLSEPMLQCLLSEYLDDLAKTDAQKSLEFGQRLESDGAAYRAALSALTEAVFCSTMACTAEIFEDFEHEVAVIRPLPDADIQHMRHKVFMEGMRSGVESIGMELANKLQLSSRVESFNVQGGHA